MKIIDFKFDIDIISFAILFYIIVLLNIIIEKVKHIDSKIIK